MVWLVSLSSQVLCWTKIRALYFIHIPKDRNVSLWYLYFLWKWTEFLQNPLDWNSSQHTLIRSLIQHFTLELFPETLVTGTNYSSHELVQLDVNMCRAMMKHNEMVSVVQDSSQGLCFIFRKWSFYREWMVLLLVICSSPNTDHFP